MKTDGGHEIDEKDLEEMGMAAGEESKTTVGCSGGANLREGKRI